MRSSRSLPHAAVWAIATVVIVMLWLASRDGDVPFALWRGYLPETALFNVGVTAIVLAAAYLGLPGGRRPRVARLLLLAMSLGLSLALVELPVVVARFDYGRLLGTHRNDTWLQLANGVNRRDEELIHVHQPHTRYVGTVAGNLAWIGTLPRSYAVDVAYDRHGFRNSRDLDRADVVAIGDSIVEGAEVREAEAVTAVMARRLGEVVANLGQSNYGPQQELVVLRRYGLPLAPRVVVWFFFGGNDLTDTDAYEWRRTHAAEFLAPSASVSERSFSRNAVIALARLTTPPRRTESPIATRSAMTFTDAAGRQERLYVDKDEGPWEPQQWEAATRTLREARDLTRAAGATLLVVYVPRKLRVYTGYVEAAPDSYARTWPTNDLPQVLGRWADAHGVDYLDATLPLRAAVASGQSVYLPDDVHWNVAGHEVAGTAVADKIAAMTKASANGDSHAR